MIGDICLSISCGKVDRQGDISCRVIWHEHIEADRLIKVSILLQNFWELHLLNEKSLEGCNTLLTNVKAASTCDNQHYAKSDSFLV